MKNVLTRVFDLTVALIVLIVAAPLMFIVAVLIKLDSKGPVFYKSKRVGQWYQIFDFYKFRTMSQSADKQLAGLTEHNQYAQNSEDPSNQDCPICKTIGRRCSPLMISDEGELCENHYFKIMAYKSQASFVKIKDDPRVTPLGRFLRKSSIDELPQLFNVVLGNMSIVGNRPLPLYEAEKLTKDQSIERFNGPAGITGLWQVTKRGKADMSERERIDLDKEFVRRHGFFYNLGILLKTVPALLQSENV